ncbi:MAG: M20/M25/M40 family metallo-hydrolase [Lachnospiraceae bacterium]|nr:M20/M25/M40 family metallo-hydrolase [Lachnospiraceae bacterium]
MSDTENYMENHIQHTADKPAADEAVTENHTKNHVNRKRLVDTFLKLISIDTESYHERKMADFLKQELETLGLHVEEDDSAGKLAEHYARTVGKPAADTEDNTAVPAEKADPAGNLWTCLPGNLPSEKDNYEKAILFSSHMDTVSPGNGKKALVHEDGRITSDGSTVLGADDVSGIAEILELIRILKEHRIPHPDIEFLFTAAEEPYCQGSRLFDFKKLHARTAYVLDLSGPVGTAALAAPSILSLYIHVRGKSAHAGFNPENGIHAIQIASRAISHLSFGHVEPDTTVNLGTITGGSGKNIVPEEVYLTGEIRSMNPEKADYWLQQVTDIFRQEAESAGGSAEIICEKEFDACRCGPEEPAVQIFVKAAENLKLPVTLMETFGGSDNNRFYSHGIHGLVIANAMNQCHSTQEYTHADEMERAVRLLVEILEQTSHGF